MWTINGVDPNTYGLKVSDTPGWETAPALDYATQIVPGKAGTTLLNPNPQIGSRKINVNAHVVGSSNADMLAKLDSLKALLSAPVLTVIFNNRPTRQLICRLDGVINVDPGDVSMLTRKIAINFALTADDPWWYDTANTVVNSPTGGGFADAALGTAPVWPVLTVNFLGAVASYSVAVYKSTSVASVPYRSMDVAPPGGFVNGDVLIIDMAAKTLIVNGVAHLEYITNGDFFSLDLMDGLGDFLSSAWPKITSSYATATTYKKAWR